MSQIATSQVGLIGLAVMGQNLVLNFCDHGIRMSVFNRTFAKTREFIDHHREMSSRLRGFEQVRDFVASLERPRRIILMVKAGVGVDETIDALLPYLEAGDIVVDGGNSYYGDSLRREKALAQRQIHFVGCGISGGEEGARHGPSMMPGGSEHAKECLLDILQKIAAKDWAGQACCTWIGPEGSGHFVKMVHNGIEYGDMQLICEIYDVMRRALGASIQQCQELFTKWRSSFLDSYLIDITAQILTQKDEVGDPLVEKILDEAGQKGTGRWTVQEALELNVPLTLISQAVFARGLSAQRELRTAIRASYPSATTPKYEEFASWEDDLALALYGAKVISYAQGFRLMEQASSQRGWNLDPAQIARIWSGGCIIRSKFLKDIYEAYSVQENPKDLLTAAFLKKQMPSAISCLRRVLGLAIQAGVPVATLSSALAYFDALQSDRLPANLLQAMRDYFGAHTYQRIDQPQDKHFHTDWAKTGGRVSSTSYNA